MACARYWAWRSALRGPAAHSTIRSGYFASRCSRSGRMGGAARLPRAGGVTGRRRGPLEPSRSVNSAKESSAGAMTGSLGAPGPGSTTPSTAGAHRAARKADPRRGVFPHFAAQRTSLGQANSNPGSRRTLACEGARTRRKISRWLAGVAGSPVGSGAFMPRHGLSGRGDQAGGVSVCPAGPMPPSSPRRDRRRRV